MTEVCKPFTYACFTLSFLCHKDRLLNGYCFGFKQKFASYRLKKLKLYKNLSALYICDICRQQSEDGERNGSDDDDEEKPGKRVIGPRKKFEWDDKLRSVPWLTESPFFSSHVRYFFIMMMEYLLLFFFFCLGHCYVIWCG